VNSQGSWYNVLLQSQRRSQHYSCYTHCSPQRMYTCQIRNYHTERSSHLPCPLDSQSKLTLHHWSQICLMGILDKHFSCQSDWRLGTCLSSISYSRYAPSILATCLLRTHHMQSHPPLKNTCLCRTRYTSASLHSRYNCLQHI